MTHLPGPIRRALTPAALLGLALLGRTHPYPGVAQASSDPSAAAAIAKGLIAACPLAGPSDERARDLAATKLVKFALLRDSMRDPISWGGHTRGHSYRPADNQTTLFNSLVWRRMYLSLFMFPGPYQIEHVGNLTLLHLPCRFRNELDPGAYPYPFWHSQPKWENYQRATEVSLTFENGKIIAAYRSDAEDPTRPSVARTWDGRWHWTDAAGKEMPYVALYSYLFSGSNPHVSRLDTAYRALEAGVRQHSCFVCHSPANPARMNPLRLLIYPNQALTVRHAIVQQMEQNAMPPGEGIPDDAERQQLIELARTFAEVGDQALDYEGEFQPPDRP
jgi:hypothetical protein